MSDEGALDEEGKVILKAVRAESSHKVDQWLTKELATEALASHKDVENGETFLGTPVVDSKKAEERGGGGGDVPVVSSSSLKREASGPSLRQMFATGLSLLSTVRERFEAATPPPSEQAQRQRVSQRGGGGGMGGMDNEAKIAALPVEELVRIWREDILPNFDDRIKTRWVQSLVHRGIPRSVRGFVWEQMLGNRLKLDQKKYGEMLQRCEKVGSTIPGVDEIELDLPRTHFNGKGVDSAQLLPVLQAVSTLRPDIGYVQGMSYLGAMFMVFMAPEEAFVCLGNLVATGFFPDFLRMKLDSIRLRWRVFEVLLGQECSDLACHFDEIGLSADLYLTDWWFTLFAKDFPLSVASRVWDCFLLEGEPFLFRFALGICQHLRDELLSLNLEECSGLLSKCGKTISEKVLFQCLDHVSSSNRLIRDMLKQK